MCIIPAFIIGGIIGCISCGNNDCRRNDRDRNCRRNDRDRDDCDRDRNCRRNCRRCDDRRNRC